MPNGIAMDGVAAEEGEDDEYHMAYFVNIKTFLFSPHLLRPRVAYIHLYMMRLSGCKNSFNYSRKFSSIALRLN